MSGGLVGDEVLKESGREREKADEGTHSEDEADDKALERGGIEDSAGSLLVSHESCCKVYLFLGATRSLFQISRHYTAIFFGSDAKVVCSAFKETFTMPSQLIFNAGSCMNLLKELVFDIYCEPELNPSGMVVI